MINFRSIKITITTASGDLIYMTDFKPGLNIIRGDNSSGKSTLLSCMWYACGMEELLGGRNESVLQYVVKDYVELNGSHEDVISSNVMLEVGNEDNEIVTFKRQIKSDTKSTKLIELIHGPYLTHEGPYNVTSTFVHDGGSASSEEYGFFNFLERYMGFELPDVPAVNGGVVKLYIQCIFAAVFIEQKRGWTDYIANIPYFRIKNSFEKVVEFLLDLDVFDNDRKRASLLEELASIQKRWSETYYKIDLLCKENGIVTKNIPHKPILDFTLDHISFHIITEDQEISLDEHIGQLIEILEKYRKDETRRTESSQEDQEVIIELNERITHLVTLSDELSREISYNESEIYRYNKNIKNTIDDIERNKLASKVKNLGGDIGSDVAIDTCPTCHQNIDDTLLLGYSSIQPMTIDENIKYLESQKNMLGKYIDGTKDLVSRQKGQLKKVTDDIDLTKKTLLSHKKDIANINPTVREAALRRIISLEDKIERLGIVENELNTLLDQLTSIATENKLTKQKEASLPRNYLSGNDTKKLREFSKSFKELTSKFGYRSASITEIEINLDTYTPYLLGRELREINLSEDELKARKPNVKIENASSASDFVRLIWAYLISIYSISSLRFCNHPGIIVFDEPGQHSMSVDSINELFKTLDLQPNLQSIIAASFDESDDTYTQSTIGVEPYLIRLDRKLFSRANKQ